MKAISFKLSLYRGGKVVKQIISFCAILVFLLATTGCSSNSQHMTSASDQTVLTMMNNWGIQSADFDIYQERIKEFEEMHPNIKIQQDKVPAAEYMTKLRTLAVGKKLPDLAVVWPGAELKPLVEGNVIQPIDRVVKNLDTSINSQYLEGYKMSGHQYAVPAKLTYVSVIYYNKKLVEKAGYKQFPKDYNQFLTLVKNLRKQGITPISVGNKPKWPLQSSYVSTIGDRITGSKFLENVLEGKRKFTDPESIRTLKVIKQLEKLKAFNEDINSIDEVQNQDYFIQGKSAMIMTTSTANARLRIDSGQGKNIGIALFPKIDGGKGNPLVSPGVIQYGVGMNNNLKGKRKQAAEEFLKYFYSKELYEKQALKGIPVPINVNLPNNKDNKLITELFQLTNHDIAPVYDSVISPEVKASLENGLQAIITGGKSPEEVAKDMQKIVDKEL
ncbi:ABC transporter substrate-binding protein [Priestia megaterium]|nr:ABC transporter substrate-binding protein [Priestia megaterium]